MSKSPKFEDAAVGKGRAPEVDKAAAAARDHAIQAAREAAGGHAVDGDVPIAPAPAPTSQGGAAANTKKDV